MEVQIWSMNIIVGHATCESILSEMHPTKTQIGLQFRAVWSVFILHMKKLGILDYLKHAQRRFWSYGAIAQTVKPVIGHF